jgi:hypothetical protein
MGRTSNSGALRPFEPSDAGPAILYAELRVRRGIFAALRVRCGISPSVGVASEVEHHAPQVERLGLSTRPWYLAKRRNHHSKR